MAQPALIEQLLTAERGVWEALRTGNAGADSRALDEGFLGAGPRGFFDKATHVGQLAQGATVTAYRLSEPQVMVCGPDYALLAYRADYTCPGHTGEEAMYVSSLWRRRGPGWVNVFSQDTPASGQAVP